MTEDLLNLSRVSTTAMHGEKVDLSALAKSIAHNFQSREPARNVEFVIASCSPAEGDSRLLQIAIENLLNNAWKYTSGRPQARIEFGCQKRPAGSVYFVRDNGAGFDGRQAGRLFKPFQRLHSENEFPGTGIGLATVQRIVQLPWWRGVGRIRDRTWSNVLFHSACGECCDRSTQAGVEKKTNQRDDQRDCHLKPPKATALIHLPHFLLPGNIQQLSSIIVNYTRLQVPEKRPLAPTAGV